MSYTGIQCAYGFYRGLNNKYPKKSYSLIYTDSDLYVDKTMSGILSSGYHLNPLYQPILVYYQIKRIEKIARNKPLIEDDWEY